MKKTNNIKFENPLSDFKDVIKVKGSKCWGS